MNTQGNSKKFKHSQNFPSFDGESCAHDGHDNFSNVGATDLGKRNAQMLRNVKERIKAKHQNVSLFQSKFQSVELPDIEPRESEDTNEREEEKDASALMWILDILMVLVSTNLEISMIIILGQIGVYMKIPWGKGKSLLEELIKKQPHQKSLNRQKKSLILFQGMQELLTRFRQRVRDEH